MGSKQLAMLAIELLFCRGLVMVNAFNVVYCKSEVVLFYGVSAIDSKKAMNFRLTTSLLQIPPRMKSITLFIQHI